MIEEAGLTRDAAILDVGGGASSLAAELADRGYRDITVVDISESALRKGPAGDRPAVRKVVADVRTHDFGRVFDLWHDRAFMHFLVTEEDQAAYLESLERALGPGGHVVIATFGPDGPQRCSGLPVKRYGADELASRLGREFALVSSRTIEHRTPSGGAQQFLYAHFRRD